MADTSRTVEIIFKGTDRLSGALTPIEGALGDIGQDADFAEQKIDSLGDEFEDLGGAPVVSLNKLSTALTALAVGLVVDRFIDVNIAAERFQKTMEFATGSTQEAASEWDYAVGVANRFGIELDATTAAYSKFIAGTKGSVLSVDQLKTTFEGVAGTLSLVGSSSQDVQESLRQMTQGIGKNRFELEDLKSIAERIPGGMYAIADALGVTTAELYKNITAGEFGAEQILIFAETLNTNLEGISFDSFENALARLKTTVDLAFTDLGKAGTFTAMRKGIEGITTVVVGALGSFELLGTRIGLVIGALSQGDWNLGSDEFASSWESAVTEVAGNIEDARSKFLDFGDSAKTAAKSVGGIGEALDDVGTIQSIDDLIAEINSVGDASKKATEEVEKTFLELEKIASNERIKNIEAAVSLDIANVEANAEKAVAIIESIGTTVTSTGDLLGDLFGGLDEAGNRDRFRIEEQIELENERREEALKLQTRVTEATLAEMRARTQALQRGGSLITINGDGLAPHLEAMMFEVLGAIQTRVNAEGYSLLLGN